MVPTGAGRGGRLVAIPDRRALGRPRLSPAAFAVSVTGADCSFARGVLRRSLGRPDERAALQAQGLPFVDVGHDRQAGREVYVIDAGDGGRTLTYRRVGADPAVDHDILRAGQQLIFGRRRGVPGGGCTAGFPVRLAAGARGGLAAGHCARNDADDPVRARVFINIDAGPSREIGALSSLPWPAGQDVLAYRITSRRRRVYPQIERGDQAPLTVAGSVPTGRLVAGLPVCFAGRVSGADQCGALDSFTRRDTQRCTDVRARKGDSGGPVYYPAHDGFTRAMGVVAVSRRLGGEMCFEPIDEALRSVGATLLAP